MDNKRIKSLKLAAKHLYFAVHGVEAGVTYRNRSVPGKPCVEADVRPYGQGHGLATLVGIGDTPAEALEDVLGQLLALGKVAKS